MFTREKFYAGRVTQETLSSGRGAVSSDQAYSKSVIRYTDSVAAREVSENGDTGTETPAASVLSFAASERKHLHE